MKKLYLYLLALSILIILTGCNEETVQDAEPAIQTETATEELSVSELKTLIETTVNSANNWAVFYGSCYAEAIGNEGEYYPLACEDITSFADVKALLKQCYTEEVIEEVLNEGTLIEKNGQLYTSLYGIGGVGRPVYQVIANIKDNAYVVSFVYSGYNDDYTPNYEEDSRSSFKLVYEEDHWVFAEKAAIGFAYLLDDCEYLVEVLCD